METQVGIKAGTVVQLSTFRDKEQLPVEILSAASVDRGATAVIYQGVLKLPETPYLVALKVFPITLDNPGEEAVRRELRVVSKVSHNCVLTFIGTASLGGRTILVAPFMKNGNLLRYIIDEPQVDRRRLILQVAEGVCYLHEHAGIVHGDIKCENVLVSNDGNALVADFGLSSIIEKEESSATTMSAIRACNTLRFAAPELLLGPEDDGAREGRVRPRSKTRESDVYAIGMLILQAFTETKPWPMLRNEAVVLQVVTGNLHPHPGARITLRGLTDTWWSICTRCWTFDATKRPKIYHIWKQLEAIYTSGSPKVEMSCPVMHAVHAVAFTPCGNRIVCGDTNGPAVLLSDTGAVLWSCKHPSTIHAVALSPCGRQVCLASDDCTILRRDAESGEILGSRMTGHTKAVRSVAYSPEGAFIVSGGDDDRVLLWDAFTGKALLADTLTRYAYGGVSVAFSPNGTTIAFGSRDGRIRLYNIISPTLTELQGKHRGTVRSICFSPDRIHLVSCGHDGDIRVWDASTHQLRRVIRGHSDWVSSVAVSPSGVYIASGSYDQTIRVWNAWTGEEVCAPLTGHTDWVHSVAFSPDGRRLVSGSSDVTIRTWDLVTRCSANSAGTGEPV